MCLGLAGLPRGWCGTAGVCGVERVVRVTGFDVGVAWRGRRAVQSGGCAFYAWWVRVPADVVGVGVRRDGCRLVGLAVSLLLVVVGVVTLVPHLCFWIRTC